MKESIDIYGGNKYEKTWEAIARGRIEEAIHTIEGEISTPATSFLGLFKTKQRLQLETALIQALQVISPTKASNIIPLEEEAGGSFALEVCLLVALATNGSFEPALPKLEKQVMAHLERLSKAVSEAAGSYPSKPMSAQAWGMGAAVKFWAEELALYYRKRNNLKQLADTLNQRTRITAAIMNHYPYTLGPDMIETARAFEAIGDTDLPQRLYGAAISDFQPIADDILDAPGEEVWDNDITTMQALHDAYEGRNRLSRKPQDLDKMAAIARVIEVGATGHPEEEEEDDK